MTKKKMLQMLRQIQTELQKVWDAADAFPEFLGSDEEKRQIKYIIDSGLCEIVAGLDSGRGSYYERNKVKILATLQKKRDNDPEYRETLKKRSAARYDKLKGGAHNVRRRTVLSKSNPGS